MQESFSSSDQHCRGRTLWNSKFSPYSCQVKINSFINFWINDSWEHHVQGPIGQRGVKKKKNRYLLHTVQNFSIKFSSGGIPPQPPSPLCTHLWLGAKTFIIRKVLNSKLHQCISRTQMVLLIRTFRNLQVKINFHLEIMLATIVWMWGDWPRGSLMTHVSYFIGLV